MGYLDSDTDHDGEPKWNWKNQKAPSSAQKKMMPARTIVIAARQIMENHLYVQDILMIRTSWPKPWQT